MMCVIRLGLGSGHGDLLCFGLWQSFTARLAHQLLQPGISRRSECKWTFLLHHGSEVAEFDLFLMAEPAQLDTVVPLRARTGHGLSSQGALVNTVFALQVEAGVDRLDVALGAFVRELPDHDLPFAELPRLAILGE